MFTTEPVTLVMAAILLGAFCIPFILHFLKRNQKRSKLIQEFNRLTEPYGSPIDLQDIWRNQYIIGLMTATKTMVYYKEGEQPISHVFSLADIDDIQVKSKFRELKSGKEKKKVVDETGLLISLKNQKSVYLEFFNQDNFTDLLGESVLAEKWAELLRNQRC